MSEQIGIPAIFSYSFGYQDWHSYRKKGTTSPIRRYAGEHFYGALGGDGQSQNVIYLTPLILPSDVKIINWGFYVSVAQAGSLLRAGIYSNQPSSLWPNSLLNDLGEIATTSTGWKVSSDINLFLRGQYLYWIACWQSGSIQTFKKMYSSGVTLLGFSNTPVGNEYPGVGYKVAKNYDGIFPNPWASTLITLANEVHTAILFNFDNP